MTSTETSAPALAAAAAAPVPVPAAVVPPKAEETPEAESKPQKKKKKQKGPGAPPPPTKQKQPQPQQPKQKQAGGAPKGKGKGKGKGKAPEAAAGAPQATPEAAAAATTTIEETVTPKPGEPLVQTSPPSVPVNKLFPDGQFPHGQRQEYSQASNAWRRDSAEARSREALSEGMYDQLREAAEAHRQVRKWARGWIKPGMKMIGIADSVETAMRRTIGAKGLDRGIAFPCGLSLNFCAAHWTSNAGDTTVLGEHDVLKVDIGLHVGGRIIDSAFTMAFDPQFDPLLAAVREATDAGVAACGADVRLSEIGAAVQEVMESHEVTINGKTHQVKPIRNLFGHSLGLYRIHAGKSVPIVKGALESDRERMEEGDLIAIETFGSTGKGFVQDDLETSHYMRAFEPVHAASLRGGPKARELLTHINRNFGTLAFARRWLDQAGVTRYALALKSLVDAGAVNPYPPLCDVRGSYVAQFEHTVAIKATSKEVFSRGDDF